jgi:hypothetical protein
LKNILRTSTSFIIGYLDSSCFSSGAGGQYTGEEGFHNLVSPGGVFIEEGTRKPPGKKQPGIPVQGDPEDAGIMGIVLKKIDYLKAGKFNFGVDITGVPGRLIALLQFRNHISLHSKIKISVFFPSRFTV